MLPQEKAIMAQQKLQALLRVVNNIEGLLILPHNNPDPDALASAAGLQYLLAQKSAIPSNISYSGIIGRAENKALVQYMNLPIKSNKNTGKTPTALIDTQPKAGNITLPPNAQVVIIIDHHHKTADAPAVAFKDIRTNVGATSTILVDYLKAAGVDIPKWLATALFYGIKTNTLGLSRNSSHNDAAAYYYLQPQIDVKGLAGIEQARVSAQYFKSLDKALRNALFYNGLIISNLDNVNYPDLVAEIADQLLRLENVRWVICIGAFSQTLIVSVRTRYRKDIAEKLVEILLQLGGTTGGHGTIAGGQIPLSDQSQEELINQLTVHALNTLNIAADTPGIALI